MQSMYTESLRAFLKPVLQYLDDETVSEIMINGPQDIWIERKGKLTKTDARFSDEALLGAARNMAQFVGRTLNDERPRLDARLPDGSRIHVVLPPIARQGATISIRKFFKDKLTVDRLISFGSITQQMARIVDAGIQTKQNMIVAGGTGSGKTTLLNIVSSLIPNDERILTIEDSAELQLTQEHLVAFESRPPDKFGKGGVDMGDLLHSALRLRPDRIVVGEVRGGEAFHLMQAMNTGHGGSLATTHANTPTDTLRRLESLCLMSGVELPMVAVRAQVASAINLVVCCERLYDGSRKVTHVSEVLPLNEKGDYRTQDLWVFTPVTKDANGNILGYHAPTGIIPNFVSKARAYGFTDLTDDYFDPATYGLPPPPLFHVGTDYEIRWAKSLKHREKGMPDPEAFKEDWARFEKRLVDEAGSKAAAAPPPPAPNPAALAARPKPAAAPARAVPVARPSPQALAADDLTPAPTASPFHSVTQVAAPPPVGEEPLVQVSEELLSEAASARDDLTPPPRRTPPPARAAGPQVARSPTGSQGPVRRPTRDVPSNPQNDEKTNIRPIPERPKR